MRSILSLALALTLALAPAVSQAAEKPFFRIGASSSSTDAPPETGETPLAYSASNNLPASLMVGQTGSAAFGATGGEGPYELAANGLPDGFSIQRIGARAWTIAGAASAQGSFNPTVTLSDAKTSIPFVMTPITVTSLPPVESGALTVSAFTQSGYSYALPPYVPVGENFEESQNAPYYYAVKGGQQPYDMIIENGPPGVGLLNLNYRDPATQSYVFMVTGTVSQVANYPNMRLRATDSSSQKRSGQLVAPISVRDGAIPPYFQTTFDPTKTSVLTNERVAGFYIARGGTPPYQMALTGTSEAALEQQGDERWDLNAYFPTGGVKSGLKIVLTDANNLTAEHSLPTITVTAPEPLRFTQQSNLPPVLYAGQYVGANDSLPVTIAGFGTKVKDV